jgi:UPF0042 nucleotide-binding protein
VVSELSTHIVFVSGLSGSGKSTAMAALEDQNFYCVDNLPAQLIEQFLTLCANAVPPILRIAVAIDAREVRFLREMPRAVEALRTTHPRVDLVFLDASDQILIDRYRETRRVHPMAAGGNVAEGIERERRLLVDVAKLADKVIDTSTLNVHQLKAEVLRYIAGETRPTVVNILSFGFRYGPPQSAELLFDVRFLPNPYFEDSLRAGTGLDDEVAEYVLGSPIGSGLLDRLGDLCRYLLPLYDREGKAYLTIGIGCTGGQHRSVAIAEALAETLREHGRKLNVEHRDVGRSR